MRIQESFNRHLLRRVWPAAAGPATPAGAVAMATTRVSDIDGKNQVCLAFDPAQDRLPTWSPDGNQIVVLYDRDGDFDMCVMDEAFDSQRLRRVSALPLSKQRDR